MAEKPNLWVSNGTCYLDRDVFDVELLLPCGNDYFGHIACCQAGDYCLESSICFNSDYKVTYIAGCTDPDYQHESCPPKFATDNKVIPWEGLSYCNDTSDEWIVCDQKHRPVTITSPDPCYCPTATADRGKTIKQSSKIPAVAILPTALGESIDFFVGHYPTTSNPTTSTPMMTATITTLTLTSVYTNRFSSTTAMPTLTVTSRPVPTVDNTSAPSHTTGFNTAAKIGTAVGVTAFGLLALAALGYILLRRCHRQKGEMGQKGGPQGENALTAGGGKDKPPSDDDDNDDHTSDPYTHNIGLAIGDPDEAYPVFNPDTPPAASELDPASARPWSMASELGSGAATARSPSALSSVMMAGHGSQGHDLGSGGHGRAGPSELASQPLAELPG